MTNPFPGHHPRHVSVDTLDGIEAVAMAIQQLHDAMANVSPTHRWLAVSMMSDEIGDIMRMIQDDQLAFAAQGLRDMSAQFVTRPATDEEVRQGHEPDLPFQPAAHDLEPDRQRLLSQQVAAVMRIVVVRRLGEPDRLARRGEEATGGGNFALKVLRGVGARRAEIGPPKARAR